MKYRVKTWYYSPLPAEFQNLETLYTCQNCLAMFKEEKIMQKHFLTNQKCQDNLVDPPGNEIYRDEKLQVFEVSGRTERIYSENLCLISKLFLDHKNVRFDCSPFLFYVLVERGKNGFNLAGYFSKEVGIKVEHNLSCILIFP